MGFESPIWLLGLLPWGALVIYLLPGKGRVAVVPFLGLWRGTILPSRSMSRRWPRMAVLFAIASLLLAILAAGQPYRYMNNTVAGEIAIVLDRGATMSLPSASGKPFRNVLSLLASTLGLLPGTAHVKLLPVPGREIDSTGTSWQTTAEALPPTAISAALDPIIANELRQTRGRIFVLSDQHFNMTDPRITQVFPEAASPSVAITSIGACALPHPQVMLRLENRSDLSTIKVTIRSDTQIIRQGIPLPPRNASVDRFIDLPALGKTIQASFDFAGTPGPWSQAFLVRQSDGIHIAFDAGIDDSVQRMAKVYTANRPAETNAPTVLISTRQIPVDQIGIWIGGSANATMPVENVAIVPHAVTQNVKQWIAGDAAKSPARFLSIVAGQSVPIVAVRDNSARQVWLNANLPEWEKTADFVVFFANALDWISGSDQSFTSTLPDYLGDRWHIAAGMKMPAGIAAGEWPGVYESAAGRSIAVNAGGFPKFIDGANQRPTDGHRFGQIAGHSSISGNLVFAALTFLLFAAVLW